MGMPIYPNNQRAIVAEIETEHTLVAANREVITWMEKKIAATVPRVWGEYGANSSINVAQSHGQ